MARGGNKPETIVSQRNWNKEINMKTYKNLFEQIVTFDNLLLASEKARKGKGKKIPVAAFEMDLERNLWKLQDELKSMTYKPGSYREFTIYEYKKRKIKDEKTLWLINLIIDGSNPQEPVNEYFPGDELFTPFERRRGIPIGNLTSQFFANLYLNGFDHFIKEKLKCRYYIRYVDDFVVFADNKKRLWQVKNEMENFLSHLRLKLHEKKCFVAPVGNGILFLGYRVFPDHRRLRRENGYRFQRKLKFLLKEMNGGLDERKHAVQSVKAWIAHASHADTYGLQKALLKDTPFQQFVLT